MLSLAQQPEHCFACCRLIRARETYCLTIEQEVLCEDCTLSDCVIRVRKDLGVEIKRDRLLVRHGRADVEVFPGEVRHLVNALVESAVRLVDCQVHEPQPLSRLGSFGFQP